MRFNIEDNSDENNSQKPISASNLPAQFQITDKEAFEKNMGAELAKQEGRAAFEEATNQYDELLADFLRQKKALLEQFKISFTEVTNKFFKAVPEIKSISWTQYTPYFMDGDECIFSINEISFANFVPEEPKSYLYDDYEEEDEEGNPQFAFSSYYGEKGKISTEDFKLCKKISDMINENVDFMKEVFGDHVIIQITAEGIEIDTYDHE